MPRGTRRGSSTWYVVQCADETERLGVRRRRPGRRGYNGRGDRRARVHQAELGAPVRLANNRLYLAAIAEKNLGAPELPAASNVAPQLDGHRPPTACTAARRP